MVKVLGMTYIPGAFRTRLAMGYTLQNGSVRGL